MQDCRGRSTSRRGRRVPFNRLRGSMGGSWRTGGRTGTDPDPTPGAGGLQTRLEAIRTGRVPLVRARPDRRHPGVLIGHARAAERHSLPPPRRVVVVVQVIDWYTKARRRRSTPAPVASSSAPRTLAPHRPVGRADDRIAITARANHRYDRQASPPDPGSLARRWRGGAAMRLWIYGHGTFTAASRAYLYLMPSYFPSTVTGLGADSGGTCDSRSRTRAR